MGLLEKWKKAVDSGQMSDALLTDLSRGFDCLCHKLMIAKFNAYGLTLPALKLVHDYLSNQFVIFEPISYCFKETMGFNIKTSSRSRPVSRLIRWYDKLGDITKEFWEKAIVFHGTFHGLKITNWNRKQRTKVNRTYSSWLEIVFSIPQGPTLRPLLFNIFLADLLFILNDFDISSYADNNPYVIADDINGVIKEVYRRISSTKIPIAKA